MSLDVKNFLQKLQPFSLLPENEIKFLTENSQLDFIPEGFILLKEGSVPDYFYVVLKGSFSLQKNGNIIDIVEAGDFIGEMSIIFDQPSSFDVKAVEDSIVILIKKDIFKKIISDHPKFKEFFTQTTIKKLSEGYKKLQVEALEDLSLSYIKDFDLKKPIFCSDDDDVISVSKKMSENKSSFCIVGNEKEIKGIITDMDLKEKVLSQGIDPSKTKAKEIKTFPVEVIKSNKFIFEAVLKMIQKNIKRLPVVEKNRIIGVIEDRDIFLKQSRNILHMVRKIELEGDIENLKQMYLSIEESINDLFKTGKDIEIIQKYISEINDRFIQKVLSLTAESKDDDFSFIVMGSEGRKEQTVSTDIDNGIIFFTENTDKYLQIGKKTIDLLLKIGFPRCPGNIMASNPEWVKPYREWEKTVEDWITQPDPSNIMLTSIFFDFRVIYGNAEKAEKLRDHIFRLIQNNKNFLVVMTVKALEFEPPIGFFKDFIVEKSGEHKNELDIKKGGIFPIVQGARILSLENSIRETNTLDRIRLLKNRIGEYLSDELIESFKFMQTLRLKFQLEKIQNGKKPDNYINPEKLTKFEKDLLKDAFKIVKKFQEMLGIHFRLRV